MKSEYDDIWDRGSELILSGKSGPDYQIDPFDIEFRGKTATASCVLAQGFPVGDGLNKLRELLRKNFGSSSLRHSIDERYTIATAHSTLIRFRDEVSRPQEYIDLMSRFRGVEWGCQQVASLDLVFNDWYHKATRVKDIATFRL